MVRTMMAACVMAAGCLAFMAGSGTGARAAAGNPLPASPASGLGGGENSGAVDAKAVAALIAQLGSGEFKSREEATARLAAMGEPVRPLLVQAVKDGKLDAEQTQRVNSILGQLDMAVLRSHMRGSVTPAGLGISVEVVGKTTYRLDKAQQGQAFRGTIPSGRGGRGAVGGGRAPNPPAVELSLALTNTGTNPLTVMVGGDEGTLTLDLKGPNPGPVLYMPQNMAMTMEYRMGEPVTVKPGETGKIPISMQFGQRAMFSAYWTEPGEYTLTATYRTHTPEGDKGEAVEVVLKADPVKITVVAADAPESPMPATQPGK